MFAVRTINHKLNMDTIRYFPNEKDARKYAKNSVNNLWHEANLYECSLGFDGGYDLTRQIRSWYCEELVV